MLKEAQAARGSGRQAGEQDMADTSVSPGSIASFKAGVNSQAAAPIDDPRAAFLSLFDDPNDRNVAAQITLRAVREGATRPSEVLERVRRKCQRIIDEADEAVKRLPQTAEWVATDVARYTRILTTLDRPEATNFAAWALHWEALPTAERERIKSQRADSHRRAFMASEPPTTKQLSFLKSLGYAGPPIVSKLDASQRIDALLQRQQGGRRG